MTKLKKSSNNHKRWTPEEDKQLETYLSMNLKAGKIAQLMGRTANSVYLRSSRVDRKELKTEVENLRLHSSRWNSNQDHKLQKLVDSGCSDEQIAHEMGRTVASISWRRSHLKNLKSTRAKAVSPAPVVVVKAPPHAVTRETVSDLTDHIGKVSIPTEITGLFIGRGGENIRKLTSAHDVQISIFEGVATVKGAKRNVEEAVSQIEKWLKFPTEGDIYEAVVIGTASFGTFFGLTPVHQGLLHFSKYTKPFTRGEKANVRIEKVTPDGRVQLELVNSDISGEIKKLAEELSRKIGKAVKISYTID